MCSQYALKRVTKHNAYVYTRMFVPVHSDYVCVPGVSILCQRAWNAVHTPSTKSVQASLCKSRSCETTQSAHPSSVSGLQTR